MIHFWIIFHRGNSKWGWRAYETNEGEIIAYRTRREASKETSQAMKMYGRGEVRIYKFRPADFIFGACK